MTRDDVFRRVQGIICDKLNKSVTDVKETSKLGYDLGMDSLDVMELGMGVQDEFKIEITDEELAKFKSVGSVVEIIVNKI